MTELPLCQHLARGASELLCGHIWHFLNLSKKFMREFWRGRTGGLLYFITWGFFKNIPRYCINMLLRKTIIMQMRFQKNWPADVDLICHPHMKRPLVAILFSTLCHWTQTNLFELYVLRRRTDRLSILLWYYDVFPHNTRRGKTLHWIIIPVLPPSRPEKNYECITIIMKAL